ncbi:MAG TPA: methyltransferase domain-containing protein [Cyclobacteriaceae bacterium]|nr:methyltransferase domain-containing protein [Cyclobacteriaceae bacterium]
MKFLYCFLISTTLFAQDPWKNVYTQNAWQERDSWQKPQELLKQLNIRDGSTVADIGCHEGYMTMKLSKVVGAKGKVFAVDIEQSKLSKLKDHLSERKIVNVELVKGDEDNPKLSGHLLDAAIILDTYHEMDDHDSILQHVKVALKPGGRLVICEPIADERKSKSRSDQEARHELSMNYVLDDLTKAGFQIIYKKETFVDRTKVKGDNMWIVVAQKPR